MSEVSQYVWSETAGRTPRRVPTEPSNTPRVLSALSNLGGMCGVRPAALRVGAAGHRFPANCWNPATCGTHQGLAKGDLLTLSDLVDPRHHAARVKLMWVEGGCLSAPRGPRKFPPGFPPCSDELERGKAPPTRSSPGGCEGYAGRHVCSAHVGEVAWRERGSAPCPSGGGLEECQRNAEQSTAAHGA